MNRFWHRRLGVSAAALLAIPLMSSNAFPYAPDQTWTNGHGERTRSAGIALRIFLRIEGVEGESLDAAHKGWIDIQSFSWGATGASATTSSALQDLHLVANTSKATAALLDALGKGARYQTVMLSVVRVGPDKPVEYLTYTLRDVAVSSFQMGASTAASTTDQFSLSYRSLEIAYREQKPDGTVAAPINVLLASVKY